MRHCAREPGSPRTSRGQGFQRPLVQGIPAGTRPPAPGDHARVRVGRPPFPQRACVCAWVQSGPVYGNRAEGEDGRRAWRSAVLLLPPGVHLLRGTSSRRRPPRRRPLGPLPEVPRPPALRPPAHTEGLLWRIRLAVFNAGSPSARIRARTETRSRARVCACARVRCASPCLSPSTCSFPSLSPSSCLYLLSQRTPHTDHRKPRTSGSFESNTVGLRRGGMSGPGGPSGRTRAVKQVLRSNQASKHLTLTFYSVHPKIPFEPPKESLPGKSKGNVTGNGEYLHLYLNL